MLPKRHHAPGTAPATLVARPGQESVRPVVTVIEYGPESYSERELNNSDEALAPSSPGKVRWINVDGLGDIPFLRRLGERFGLHPLALEDVLNTGQRPKLEVYEDHLFIVAQMLVTEGADAVDAAAGPGQDDGADRGGGDEGGGGAHRDEEIAFEQVSMFLREDVLITIQEEPTHDAFVPVRSRLRTGRGFARTRGHDYLAYALLDSVVDHYFPILERIGERLEQVENDVYEHPDRRAATALQNMKRLLLHLRRAAWPSRELFAALARDDTGRIAADTKVFLRDCYDHVVQLMDVVESYREMAGGLMEVYLTSLSARTNEIMRVLTVISSVFIPLTFLAGLYGMNFEMMPELKMTWAYPTLLVVMTSVAILMVLFFKRKKWL